MNILALTCVLDVGNLGIDGIQVSLLFLLFNLSPFLRLYLLFLPFFCQLGFTITL